MSANPFNKSGKLDISQLIGEKTVKESAKRVKGLVGTIEQFVKAQDLTMYEVEVALQTYSMFISKKVKATQVYNESEKNEPNCTEKLS